MKIDIADNVISLKPFEFLVNPLSYRLNYYCDWLMVLLYSLSNKSFRMTSNYYTKN
jgi:hypothetical protein